MNLTKKLSKPITAILIAASITSTVHASDFSNDYVLYKIEANEFTKINTHYNRKKQDSLFIEKNQFPIGETLKNKALTENTNSEESKEILSDDKYTEAEVYLVAQLVYNEARGEGKAGQLAVAEVVKNRVDSDKFPSDVRSVIYQKGQFADNHLIAKRRPSSELVALVDSVLNGNVTLFNNPDVLYFRNAKGYTGSWGRFPHYATVNHHEFYLG